MLRCGNAVLIIEDDAAVRDLMAKIVDMLGFEVVATANGAEGLAAFFDRGGDFAAVLLDAIMPVMDGAETLRDMRRMRPETPVICISGHRPEDLVPFFGEAQPDHFVTKPCTPDQIRWAISRFAPMPSPDGRWTLKTMGAASHA